jgi:hypothetical protein
LPLVYDALSTTIAICVLLPKLGTFPGNNSDCNSCIAASNFMVQISQHC